VADRKSIALAVGVAVGAAAVAAAIAVYVARHRETPPRDVDEILQAAKDTVRQLDEALEALRTTSEPA
jgi:acyl-CoA reductase-like NAD-dependent aldehyde dehydrogenase